MSLNVQATNLITADIRRSYSHWTNTASGRREPSELCQALLAFLRSGGKMEEYWKVQPGIVSSDGLGIEADEADEAC